MYYHIIYYLIIIGILVDTLARSFRNAFYRPLSNYIRRSSQSTILRVSCRSARSVTPVNNSSIDDSRVAQLHCYSDKPASFLPGLASGHFISHPLRPRSREGGQWNSSLRISERHPSPTPLSPPTSPPFFPQHHLSRSVLHRSCHVHSSRRFLAFTLSLYLPLSFAEIGYTSAEESGENARGQIEMLYYLNSVATTVRDLLVDVAPDSPL